MSIILLLLFGLILYAGYQSVALLIERPVKGLFWIQLTLTLAACILKVGSFKLTQSCRDLPLHSPEQTATLTRAHQLAQISDWAILLWLAFTYLHIFLACRLKARRFRESQIAACP